MEIIKTLLEGVYILEPNVFSDERGDFVKIYTNEAFEKFGLRADFKESYFSVSKKNVIRGMHFQAPPAEHIKLVYVTKGKILDVVLDIRTSSPTYGKYISQELSSKNHKITYLPAGVAHGFLSLENDSYVIYSQTSVYTSNHDKGVHFDSFGMSWGVKNPIVSARDKDFPTLNEFKSPFI
jgi:dTDP-4-dehydrorhamnose 3,5-epimerase